MTRTADIAPDGTDRPFGRGSITPWPSWGGIKDAGPVLRSCQLHGRSRVVIAAGWA